MWSLHRRGRGDMWDLNRDAPWLADSLRAHYEQRSFGGALFPRAAREKWSGTDPIRSQALTGRPIPAIAGNKNPYYLSVLPVVGIAVQMHDGQDCNNV